MVKLIIVPLKRHDLKLYIEPRVEIKYRLAECITLIGIKRKHIMKKKR